jgi:L-serine dehydratase
MRITYDFYQQQQAAGDKLDKATKLQVNLFGSLSATGKGHGTERPRSRAGRKEPATVDPKFLDGLRDKPDQVFPVSWATSPSMEPATSSTMPPRATSNT